jgi:hypothetical protein
LFFNEALTGIFGVVLRAFCALKDAHLSWFAGGKFPSIFVLLAALVSLCAFWE